MCLKVDGVFVLVTPRLSEHVRVAVSVWAGSRSLFTPRVEAVLARWSSHINVFKVTVLLKQMA